MRNYDFVIWNVDRNILADDISLRIIDIPENLFTMLKLLYNSKLNLIVKK